MITLVIEDMILIRLKNINLNKIDYLLDLDLKRLSPDIRFFS